MKKEIELLRLWEIYGVLLTERKREIGNLYFNCDLSLGEIAEEMGCSRQSVSDCIAKIAKQVSEYEEKLHFVHKLAQLEAFSEALDGASGAKLKEILGN